MIFISHRTTDKYVADMLVDFFSATGVPINEIFCSSLPGNDVKTKISKEVKEALNSSVVNIAILSNDYYKSAYCLNEAGILWYKEEPVILIALPEIDINNMYGFLDNDYKLHRLDSETDISDIYDTVREALKSSPIRTSTIISESHKLISRYKNFTNTGEKTISKKPISIKNNFKNYSVSDMTTDDERIVLYCLLEKGSRRITKGYVTDWLRNNEVYDVDIDNAFDLLSSFDGGKVENDTLFFGVTAFREYSSNSESIMMELEKCVNNHKNLSSIKFKKLLDTNAINDIQKLFVEYIIEEKVCHFGSNWKAEKQVESIKKWESENNLYSALSSNYEKCLDFLIQNKLVYESDWTSYSNPREYTLYNSVKNFLFNFPKEYIKELNDIKNTFHSSDLDLLDVYDDELPF